MLHRKAVKMLQCKESFGFCSALFSKRKKTHHDYAIETTATFRHEKTFLCTRVLYSTISSGVMNKWMKDRCENREIINSCYSNPLLLRIEYPSQDESLLIQHAIRLVWQALIVWLHCRASEVIFRQTIDVLHSARLHQKRVVFIVNRLDYCPLRYASDDEPKNHSTNNSEEVGRKHIAIEVHFHSINFVVCIRFDSSKFGRHEKYLSEWLSL